jgi:hypothetical protein
MAHAYSGLGSWARSAPTIAAGYVGYPSHLLVVGAGNSVDLGPARLRQEVRQGARWRLMYDGF